MTVMNIIAIVTFIIGVPGIGWMIWDKEKVIRFEQRMKRAAKDRIVAAVLWIQHILLILRKGAAFRGGAA